VNIRTFYLVEEADIWSNIVKDKWQGLEFTWARFLEELSAYFYPITIQRHKQEFMELRMSDSMMVM